MLSQWIAAVAAWGVISVVSGEPLRSFSHELFERQDADLSSLAPALSQTAKIYRPGAPEFTTLTTRWSNLEPPTPNIVIVPGTEKDVSEIVSLTKHRPS
jgi:hypothetical protein